MNRHRPAVADDQGAVALAADKDSRAGIQRAAGYIDYATSLGAHTDKDNQGWGWR